MKIFVLTLIALCSLNFYTESAAVVCEYLDSPFGYSCKVKYLKITSKNDRIITDVIGDHQSEKTLSDVVYFNLTQNIVKFFPLELASFFKNLKTIQIIQASLSELHSSDLQQFGDKLEDLWLIRNKIDILEADVFKFNPNLENLQLYGNNLRYIDENAFRGLEKLHDLHLQGGNPCLSYLKKFAENRTAVVSLLAEIKPKCKDYSYVFQKYRETYQTQIDVLNLKLLQCQIKQL